MTRLFDTDKISVEEIQKMKDEGLSWKAMEDKLKKERNLNVPEKRLRQKWSSQKQKAHTEGQSTGQAESSQTANQPSQDERGKIKTFTSSPKPSGKHTVGHPSVTSSPDRDERNPECPYCEEELCSVKDSPAYLWCRNCQKLFKRD